MGVEKHGRGDKEAREERTERESKDGNTSDWSADSVQRLKKTEVNRGIDGRRRSKALDTQR